jgi:hypothetical protein
MNRKSNRQLISEMRNKLDEMSKPKRRKLTLESYVFDEGADMNNVYPDETNNPGFDDGQPDFYEEGESVDPSMKPLIDNIRITCLDCLKKLGQTPEAPEYELFKKIWQLCDKAVEVKNNPQKA